MPTNVRDPRSLVTPDAFEISPALFGLPLASPWRRLSAILVDLAVVGMLTALLEGVGLLLWGTVAVSLLYAALRRPERLSLGPHATLLLRFSMGCLGTAILTVVLIVAGVSWFRGDGVSDGDSEGVPRLVADALRSAGPLARAAEDLSNADSEEEAERAAVAFLREMPDLRMSREQRMEMLQDMTPADASWRESADRVYRRALDSVMEAPDAAGPAARAPGEIGTAGAADPAALPQAQEPVPVDSLTEAEALTEYAALVAAGVPDENGPAAERARALRRRLLPALGADTLRALEEALEEEREEKSELDAEVERLTERSGLAGLFRDVWEQLGSAIGLWSLYFTVLLTVFKGQTLGKRLAGIRVVRLDGEPLTWWSSFERAGGYVAGIATGLLGFAQVFWDANRQCVHDKIVGTVVVIAGASPLPVEGARPARGPPAGPGRIDEGG